MTTGTEGNGDRSSRKAEILQKISARGLTPRKVMAVAERVADRLTKMKIATTAVLYFYLSLFGVIFDLTFYENKYGLDPFKYAKLEDFIFSAAKHWDVTLVVLLFVLAALVFLVLLWNAFVAATWTVCYLTPDRLENPTTPARPSYRRSRSVYSGVEGVRVWREFRSSVRATVSDRTTRGWSNLRALVKFARENVRYRCLRAVSVVRQRLFDADRRTPSEPPSRTYRGPSWAFQNEAGNKAWGQLWSDFRASVRETTTRACSNLWMSFEFGGASIVYLLISALARSCNGLIGLYGGIAGLPQKLLRPVKAILIAVAALVCFAVAPTVGADLILSTTSVESAGEKGILCTRRPDHCDHFRHVGSTSSYAFFQNAKLEQDTKRTGREQDAKQNDWKWWGFLRFFEGLFFWRSFESWKPFKESIGLEGRSDSKSRPLQPVQVVPLSNIASFTLHGTKRNGFPPDDAVTLPELEKALDSAKSKILVGIEANNAAIFEGVVKILDGSTEKPLSLAELRTALDGSSREILDRIEEIIRETRGPAKAINLTTLKLAIEANNAAIVGGVAKIGGGSTEEPVSLAELKAVLERNSENILGRIAGVDGRVAENTAEVAEGTGRIETALSVGKKELLGGIHAVNDRVERHSEAAAVTAAKVETSLGEGKREILGRIGMVDDRMANHSEAAVMAAGRIEKALDAGKREVLDHLDKVDEHVGDGTKKIAAALDGSKQEIIDRIDQFERSRPPNWHSLVTRYIVINRTQTDGADPKVRTRHIYSLAGFEKGESNLIPYHQGWLADFGNAMRECGVNRPKIRIIGFSSAETFKGPIERLPNLCKSQRPRTTQEESAINNCSLANHRVGEVASAIFEAMKTARRPTKEELLNSMNSQCAGSAGDFQPANFTFMNIKPWCQVPDMQNARFSVGSDDVEKQPNFLNKGVHIVILDSNNCPGF